MPTGLTYATYKTQIATMAVVAEDDTAFLEILPLAIDYAELRIQRDLDLLQTSTSVVASLASGTRQITVTQGTFVTSEQINVLTPAGTVDPETGTRNPLLPTTKEFLDAVYGASTYTGLPKYFVPFNDNLWLVGPFSDDNYSVEIVGTTRLTPISATNSSNFISLYFPDLLVIASMIYISGYQRNFGLNMPVNDEAMAVNFESQYKTLLKGAAVEEARKSFTSAAWSSQPPAVVASPSRG